MVPPPANSTTGEGKLLMSTQPMYPTRAELYKVIPQNKEAAYKEAAGSFGPILCTAGLALAVNWGLRWHSGCRCPISIPSPELES